MKERDVPAEAAQLVEEAIAAGRLPAIGSPEHHAMLVRVAAIIQRDRASSGTVRSQPQGDDGQERAYDDEADAPKTAE